jgi:hypothetical protein
MRAWWWVRQGLSDASHPRTIETCIRRSGWLPTAGSPGVYLSFRARMPKISREAVDRAAVDGHPLFEVPGVHARPPMLVPREEAALALRLHRMVYDRHVKASIRSGAIDIGETRSVAAAAIRALEEGPMSSADLRRVLRQQDLGDTLTGALIDLRLRGIVRRLPADARLDSPKYLFELLHPDDRPDLDAEGDDARVEANVMKRVLEWWGPVTLDEASAWMEVTKKAAQRALDAISAEAVTLEGDLKGWLNRGDVAEWRAFRASPDERVALLPYRDPFVSVRRPPLVLADDPDAPVLDRRLKPTHLADVDALHHHAIVRDGGLIGIWDYAPEENEVVTRLWSRDRGLVARVRDAASETTQLIRRQIGDMRMSASDPPADRARRVAFCRSEPAKGTNAGQRVASRPAGSTT